MICSSCKAIIPDDSLFCEKCGARIDVVVESVSEDAPSEEAPMQMDASNVLAAGDSSETPQPAASSSSPDAAMPLPPAKAEETVSQLSEKLAPIGLFAGALCVVVALIGLVLSGGGVETTSFGGDYQTYTYQGIAAISKELELLNRVVCVGLGAFGVFMICHFGQMMSARRAK